MTDASDIAAATKIVAHILRSSPARGPGWTAGIRGVDGGIAVTFVLGSFDQVALLRSGLEPLGYQMTVLDAAHKDCDFVFGRREAAGDELFGA